MQRFQMGTRREKFESDVRNLSLTWRQRKASEHGPSLCLGPTTQAGSSSWTELQSQSLSRCQCSSAYSSQCFLRLQDCAVLAPQWQEAGFPGSLQLICSTKGHLFSPALYHWFENINVYGHYLAAMKICTVMHAWIQALYRMKVLKVGHNALALQIERCGQVEVLVIGGRECLHVKGSRPCPGEIPVTFLGLGGKLLQVEQSNCRGRWLFTDVGWCLQVENFWGGRWMWQKYDGSNQTNRSNSAISYLQTVTVQVTVDPVQPILGLSIQISTMLASKSASSTDLKEWIQTADN